MFDILEVQIRERGKGQVWHKKKIKGILETGEQGRRIPVRSRWCNCYFVHLLPSLLRAKLLAYPIYLSLLHLLPRYTFLTFCLPISWFILAFCLPKKFKQRLLASNLFGLYFALAYIISMPNLNLNLPFIFLPSYPIGDKQWHRLV